MTSGKRLNLEDLQALAQAKGGSCLSPRALGALEKHRWRCAHGHEWETKPACVQMGRWCPVCSRSRNRLTLEVLQENARERGGKLLSDTYLGALIPLRWQCAMGHQWEATPNHVRRGSWCPACNRGRVSLERLERLTRARGGHLQATLFLGEKVAHQWTCGHGHVWSALPRDILAGTWCPECRQGTLNPR